MSVDYQPSLASGKAPWWKISRPRLAAPASLAPEPPSSPQRTRGDDVSGVGRWRVIGTRVAWTVGGVVVALAGAGTVLWLIFALTILPTPSISGDRYVVKWGTWPQGQAPIGAVVVADATPIQTDLGSRFGYIAGSDSLSVVQITGDTRDALLRDPDLRQDHYVVSCVVGECVTGEFLLPTSHVMGELVGQYQPPFTVEQVQVEGQPLRGAS